jgi:hypothetical protein
MRTSTRLALGFCLLIAPAAVKAQAAAPDHQHPQFLAPTSPYAGYEARDIKSLSGDDIAQLEAGTGWGQALAAELNGVPGPAHVLELADELELTDAQRAAVEHIHAAMTEQAKAAGARLIAAEAMLEAGFRQGVMPPQALYGLVMNAGRARAELRFVHLSAHLQMPFILSEEQAARYADLRGYTQGGETDPCAAMPVDHDPEMWKAHHNCE